MNGLVPRFFGLRCNLFQAHGCDTEDLSSPLRRRSEPAASRVQLCRFSARNRSPLCRLRGLVTVHECNTGFPSRGLAPESTPHTRRALGARVALRELLGTATRASAKLRVDGATGSAQIRPVTKPKPRIPKTTAATFWTKCGLIIRLKRLPKNTANAATPHSAEAEPAKTVNGEA